MQFQVPQFIEVEDKIFGPLTFRQFLYFLGGGGAAFLLWRFLPFIIAVPIIVAIVGLAAALALAQWNGRPFVNSLEAGFYYLLGSKLYLWSHERKKAKKKEKIEEVAMQSEIQIPKLSESRLHQLAWSLDIQEKLDKAALSKDARQQIGGGPFANTTRGVSGITIPKNALIQ